MTTPAPPKPDRKPARPPADPDWAGEQYAPRALRVAAAYSWRLLLVAAALAVVVTAIGKLLVVVVPFVIALFLATLLEPPAGWLKRRGVPDWAAALLMITAFIGVLAAIIVGVEARVAARIADLDFSVQAGLRRVAEFVARTPLDISEGQFVSGVNQAVDRIVGQGGPGLASIVTGATTLAAVLAATVLALFILFFLIKDGELLWRPVVGLFPAHRRRTIDELGRIGWRTLRAFLGGIVIVATIDAVLIGLALILIDVPLVVPLMVLTFAGAFFPIIGAFAAGLVATLVALVSGGIGDALLVAGAVVLVQQVEGNVLYPWIMSHRVHLHPLVTGLAVTTGAVLAGVLGAFVAVPLTAVVGSVASYLREQG